MPFTLSVFINIVFQYYESLSWQETVVVDLFILEYLKA